MRAFPFRFVFFLVAVVLLGAVATGVNLPHAFQAGSPIRAAEVNANFAAVASAVESRAVPSELIVTEGAWLPDYSRQALIGSFEFVTTETTGRWFIQRPVTARPKLNS